MPFQTPFLFGENTVPPYRIRADKSRDKGKSLIIDIISIIVGFYPQKYGS